MIAVHCVTMRKRRSRRERVHPVLDVVLSERSCGLSLDRFDAREHRQRLDSRTHRGHDRERERGQCMKKSTGLRGFVAGQDTHHCGPTPHQTGASAIPTLHTRSGHHHHPTPHLQNLPNLPALSSFLFPLLGLTAGWCHQPSPPPSHYCVVTDSTTTRHHRELHHPTQNPHSVTPPTTPSTTHPTCRVDAFLPIASASPQHPPPSDDDPQHRQSRQTRCGCR
jgi:hypothetical protein